MIVGSVEKADGARPPSEENGITSTISARTVLILIGVAVILRVGQEIFVPLALALLLTFMLAPIVSFFRSRRIPKIAAVLLAVAFAFVSIAVFSFVVATQVANLAQNIPTYQRNIVAKVDALAHTGSDNSVLQKVQRAVERVGEELKFNATESQKEAPVPAIDQRQPLPVEIIARSNPIETLGNLIIPLIGPFATAGLVVVLVIFMLLEREDLRDRFIRLVGLGDLHKTTAALQEAGKRVGKYLLMQLVVNTLYAIPITIGLWLLGIPNAILWGLLTLVLRFVPYIGPLIGMILPLFLALAIAPGWSLVAWVAGLFIVTELTSNNIVEPWLYGSHTGLSSLAIIVSAIFWSWLWGPVGLMLSTPLTVCLMVLGRYVPQFDFLDVLLGNQPVLRAHEKLYQRLLAGDPNEATDNAEEFLMEEYLVDYYESVALPALILGEADRQRGVMTERQIALVASTALTLVENLAEIADDEESDEESEHTPTDEIKELPDGRGRTVACVGGRSALDRVAASMLAQVLAVQGAGVVTEPDGASPGGVPALSAIESADTAVVAFLNGRSKSHARQVVRRLKRLKPGLRVGVLLPAADGDQYPKVAAEELNADFVSSSISEAIREALSSSAAVELKATVRRLARPTQRRSIEA
ncbi:AI-2E family transporter [Rhizobium sp. BK176]|uniref:AI-2E family transporter n=1 Tax=Rhizobium sp. BK176 TaxID=2587071 RepID=UPI002A41E512|nr:putative PurR-regulated permease PerM [Rhizobium sp. BK176]